MIGLSEIDQSRHKAPNKATATATDMASDKAPNKATDKATPPVLAELVWQLRAELAAPPSLRQLPQPYSGQSTLLVPAQQPANSTWSAAEVCETQTTQACSVDALSK